MPCHVMGETRPRLNLLCIVALSLAAAHREIQYISSGIIASISSTPCTIRSEMRWLFSLASCLLLVAASCRGYQHVHGDPDAAEPTWSRRGCDALAVESWCFFDDMPAEMVEAIADCLEIEDYVALFSTSRRLASMRSPRLEKRLLIATAREIAGYVWYQIEPSRRINARLRSVADLYRFCAELPRSFSTDKAQEEKEAAAARFVACYAECASLAELAKDNQAAWERNCAKALFSGERWSAIWSHLPEAFREAHRTRALVQAAEQGNLVAFDHLLGAEDYDWRAISMVALILARRGHFELFRVVLQRRFELESDSCKVADILGVMFWAACKHGRRDFLEELLKLDAAGDALFYGPFGAREVAEGLEDAVYGGWTDIVRRLLLLCNNPIYDPINAFRRAVAEGWISVVEAGLRREMGVPLYPELVVSDDEVRVAAENGHVEVLKRLLGSLPEDRLHPYVDEESRVGRAIVRLVGWDFLWAHLIPLPDAKSGAIHDEDVDIRQHT